MLNMVILTLIVSIMILSGCIIVFATFPVILLSWSPEGKRERRIVKSVSLSFNLAYIEDISTDRAVALDRSISGIRECEQKVLLLASENYLFYIKAANSFGASEQSEAALISTRGTRFHLLPDSAPPALELSEDRATVYYHEEAFNQRANINECLSIQGELLPPRGYHYWETTVGSSDAYRIGVAYPETARDNPLGEDSTSWCIHCVPTATSCRFELLHDNAQTAIFTVEVPTRIGTLLDFIRGRLSFFNAQNGQLLGSHWHRFASGCQAVLALERPGALELHMVSEVPEFAKH